MVTVRALTAGALLLQLKIENKVSALHGAAANPADHVELPPELPAPLLAGRPEHTAQPLACHPGGRRLTCCGCSVTAVEVPHSRRSGDERRPRTYAGWPGRSCGAHSTGRHGRHRRTRKAVVHHQLPRSVSRLDWISRIASRGVMNVAYALATASASVAVTDIVPMIA